MPVFKWDNVTDSDSLPKGTYQAEIASWKRSVSNNGNLMIALRYKIEEPEQFRGTSLFDRFVIGIPGVDEEDPWGMAKDDEIDGTKFGTKLLQRVLKAAQVPMGEAEFGETLDSLQGQSVLVYIENELYDGKARPKVKGYYPIGARPVEVTEETPDTTPVVRLAARPVLSSRRTKITA